MSWSAAEIMTLGAKAARGGGAPPGQAERFGHVAALHLLSGRAPEVLEAALAALPAGPILDHPLAVDRALHEVGRGVPAILRDARDDDLLASYVQALPFYTRLAEAGARDMRLRVSFSTPRARPIPRRITGCGTLVSRMEALAKRTLVPESETSREGGAGAGLSDND